MVTWCLLCSKAESNQTALWSDQMVTSEEMLALYVYQNVIMCMCVLSCLGTYGTMCSKDAWECILLYRLLFPVVGFILKTPTGSPAVFIPCILNLPGNGGDLRPPEKTPHFKDYRQPQIMAEDICMKLMLKKLNVCFANWAMCVWSLPAQISALSSTVNGRQ